MVAVVASGALVAVMLEALVRGVLGHAPNAWLRLAMSFVGFDIALGLMTVVVVAIRLRREKGSRALRKSARRCPCSSRRTTKPA